MSRRTRAGAALAAGVTTALAPGIAAAHAMGDGTFRLPVPLWLYLVGAGLAVAASFVVATIISRPSPDRPAYELRTIEPGAVFVARAIWRNVGMVWWYGAIAVGFVVGDISPLPAVLLWIGIWVGLPIAAALLGNPWPSLSPFRTTFAGLAWLASRFGTQRLDLGLAYPTGLARWPAVAFLAAGIWAELIGPGSADARTVATIMLAYTLFTLAGMIAFGQVAWLRHAELFEVELGWLGRIGPIGRRSVSAQLCDGCGEACGFERCIDCPECSVAADDPDRQPGRRWWVTGLTDVVCGNWSDAAFIILLLAGVTYDGMRETGFGVAVLEALLTPVAGLFGLTLAAFLVVDTLGLALLTAAFGLAFWGVLRLTRLIGGVAGLRPGVYAASLLPIAAGYLVAHYLTYVIQGIAWLPLLIVDPLLSVSPDMSWVPVAGVWYLSVAAIVGGHVSGVVIAHRRTVLDMPRRAGLAGLPMVVLMIGYTVLSLWIIAQPMVVDPGVRPS